MCFGYNIASSRDLVGGYVELLELLYSHQIRMVKDGHQDQSIFTCPSTLKADLALRQLKKRIMESVKTLSPIKRKKRKFLVSRQYNLPLNLANDHICSNYILYIDLPNCIRPFLFHRLYLLLKHNYSVSKKKISLKEKNGRKNVRRKDRGRIVDRKGKRVVRLAQNCIYEIHEICPLYINKNYLKLVYIKT